METMHQANGARTEIRTGIREVAQLVLQRT
jgi:hypothetical protein